MLRHRARPPQAPPPTAVAARPVKGNVDVGMVRYHLAQAAVRAGRRPVLQLRRAVRAARRHGRPGGGDRPTAAGARARRLRLAARARRASRRSRRASSAERCEPCREVPQRRRLVHDAVAAQLAGAARPPARTPRSRSRCGSGCRCARGMASRTRSIAAGVLVAVRVAAEHHRADLAAAHAAGLVERDGERLARVLRAAGCGAAGRGRRGRRRARRSGCTTGTPAAARASPRYAVERIR